jgi:hypothetical protein
MKRAGFPGPRVGDLVGSLTRALLPLRVIEGLYPLDFKTEILP